MRLLAAALCGLLLIQSAPGAARKTTSRKSSTSRKKAKQRGAKAPAVNAQTRASTANRVTRNLHSGDITIENQRALVPFFEQLYRLGQEPKSPLSILQYGDSHTASDDWPGTLRELFQSRFGSGGAGFSHAGRPWNTYRRMDVKSGGSKGWYSDGLALRDGDGNYGLSGVSITASRPGEWVTLLASGPVLEVLYLQQPGGGSLQLTADDQPVEIIRTDGELGAGSYRREMPPGEHRYELRTLDSAPVRLFGWVTGNPTGITYETLGINGAQASIVLNWNEPVLASNVGARSPALIVLAYGTNEASNRSFDRDNYEMMFAEVVQRFRRAAPAASILVIGPPDRSIRVRGKGWVTYDAVDRIVEAQRQAALAGGCAFLDLRSKMGGKGAMRSWVVAGLAQRDYVHFTGSGYKLLGESIFRDLMAQFDIFRKARETADLSLSHEPRLQ